MIPIKNIGNFFLQNKDGAILNNTSLKKIPSHWIPLVGQIKILIWVN